MSYKLLIPLALVVSSLAVEAWSVSGIVSCPNENSAAGIVVYVGDRWTTTEANGAFFLELPDTSGTFSVCVDKKTLPPGASVLHPCVPFTVTPDAPFANVRINLSGPFCTPPPPQGACWLTGGGTIGKLKGKPVFSYGGVINPGCSPTAAGGGNWNVFDQVNALHFKGLNITVTNCLGVPTRSPRVRVNIIQFQGTGTITGIRDNPTPAAEVFFVGQAIDRAESGAGRDSLYLRVFTASDETLLQIGTPEDPALVTTGNLQIHTTSCDK